jgi:hypothetical protein
MRGSPGQVGISLDRVREISYVRMGFPPVDKYNIPLDSPVTGGCILICDSASPGAHRVAHSRREKRLTAKKRRPAKVAKEEPNSHRTFSEQAQSTQVTAFSEQNRKAFSEERCRSYA